MVFEPGTDKFDKSISMPYLRDAELQNEQEGEKAEENCVHPGDDVERKARVLAAVDKLSTLYVLLIQTGLRCIVSMC